MQIRKRNFIWLGAIVLAALAIAGASASGVFANLFGNSVEVTLPAGTPISVRLDHALASDQHEAGSEFDATVTAPVIIDGRTIIAQGARARGVVVEAKESGRLQGLARIRLELSEVEVNGDLLEVSSSSVVRSAGDHKKRNWIMIGGGTGVGATLGGLAGGPKGAVIGGAAGAAAGTAAAAATGKQAVTLPAETQLTFKLSEPITVRIRS